ncbi:MAG: hypothetical protein J7578_23075 [Chitinophagaceae bacterium]|nr:hypothetical protein [Chitinophagaceae bacterium]
MAKYDRIIFRNTTIGINRNRHHRDQYFPFPGINNDLLYGSAIQREI